MILADGHYDSLSFDFSIEYWKYNRLEWWLGHNESWIQRIVLCTKDTRGASRRLRWPISYIIYAFCIAFIRYVLNWIFHLIGIHTVGMIPIWSIFIQTKDFAFDKWDVNNDDKIDMTEFDNFMMPILEMRRNQKTDQVFQPHDKGKAFNIANLPDIW